MNYKLIGRLPIETVNFFKEEILKIKDETKKFQWIYLNYKLNFEFIKIFENGILEPIFDKNKNRFEQKAFYVPSEKGYMIHKDGVDDKVALNIALSCNENDWVRWHDDKLVYEQGDVPVTYSYKQGYGSSQNAVNIKDYENFPYTDQIRNRVGDVYIIKTDVFHSYKCSGPNDRLILQTKFKGNPTFETVCEQLTTKNFKNLIT